MRLWLLGVLAKGTAALELGVWRQRRTPGFFTAAREASLPSCEARQAAGQVDEARNGEPNGGSGYLGFVVLSGSGEGTEAAPKQLDEGSGLWRRHPGLIGQLGVRVTSSREESGRRRRRTRPPQRVSVSDKR